MTRLSGELPVQQAARDVALTIAAKAPLDTRLARLAVRTGAETDLRSGLALERLAQAVLHTTEDKQTGIGAFSTRPGPHSKGDE